MQQTKPKSRKTIRRVLYTEMSLGKTRAGGKWGGGVCRRGEFKYYCFFNTPPFKKNLASFAMAPRKGEFPPFLPCKIMSGCISVLNWTYLSASVRVPWQRGMCVVNGDKQSTQSIILCCAFYDSAKFVIVLRSLFEKLEKEKENC